jgi:octaprenyl-diphosphate synthase
MISTANAFADPTALDPHLMQVVADEVGRVETVLKEMVASPIIVVDQIGRLTLEAGGKRLRPAFVALAARAAGISRGESGRVERLGAVMEMIHMATLIHDDVIDESPTRRGKPTAAATFGNTAAILSGDVLLARAMVALADDGDLDAIRVVSAAVQDMAEGEVREVEVRGDFDLSPTDYEDILRRKTAGFIQACCELGAVAARADASTRRALRKYGYHVGMAFQIVDDVLDYDGLNRQMGKPVGTDFREGQATLPLIYLRDRLSDAESTLARSKFGNGPSADEIRMIADWMATRGAFSQAYAMAEDHLTHALRTLDDLPTGEARNLLEGIATFIRQRRH